MWLRWATGALAVGLMTVTVYRPHDLRGDLVLPVFPPQRLVSLTLATDEILLALVPPKRIAALTHLADDPRFSGAVVEAKMVPQRVRANAEQVIAFRPDLAFVAAYTSATTKELLREAGVGASSLKLEITESVIMDSPERVTALLKRLNDLGVQLCMDDFGTGYSSLSCLHRFPIDVLKIDRTFVLNTDENREYAAVIHAIISLAHTLNMSVVGEGVETFGQLAQLQALECDHAQGNFFAKSLSAEAAEDYMLGPQGFAKSA